MIPSTIIHATFTITLLVLIHVTLALIAEANGWLPTFILFEDGSWLYTPVPGHTLNGCFPFELCANK